MTRAEWRTKSRATPKAWASSTFHGLCPTGPSVIQFPKICLPKEPIPLYRNADAYEGISR